MRFVSFVDVHGTAPGLAVKFKMGISSLVLVLVLVERLSCYSLRLRYVVDTDRIVSWRSSWKRAKRKRNGCKSCTASKF
jgi:hypothetical protein